MRRATSMLRVSQRRRCGSSRRHITAADSRRCFMSAALQHQIQDYAQRPQASITLREMLKFGENPDEESVIKFAQFNHQELPVRLARKAKELESLPYGLSQTEPVVKVRNWYVQSFREILSVRLPTNIEQEQRFAELLETILERHSAVVPTMARGVLEIKQQLAIDGSADHLKTCPFLADFLDRFFMSRMSLRMLIAQQCSLSHPRPGYVGAICTNLDPREVAEMAVGDATRICEKEFGTAPDVDIVCDSTNPSMILVPTHLHHIFFEVLKNSMRAVVEAHGADNYDLPPIEFVIAEGEDEFTVKISDQGGGISRKDMAQVWSYMHTTATRPVLDPEDQSNTFNAPMAGFGYGLPLSRLFARFFGGDLQLVSLDGYGTDAHLYLKKTQSFDLSLAS